MDIGRAVENVDVRIDLAQAIAKLSPENRRILALWMMGYSQAEIGEMVGLERSWIARRLDSIRSHLWGILHIN